MYNIIILFYKNDKIWRKIINKGNIVVKYGSSRVKLDKIISVIRRLVEDDVLFKLMIESSSHNEDARDLQVGNFSHASFNNFTLSQRRSGPFTFPLCGFGPFILSLRRSSPVVFYNL